MNILKKHHGMNIVGQGGKIILFMLPSLIAAILVQNYFPQIAKLPQSVGFLRICRLCCNHSRTHFLGNSGNPIVG